jgi:hypothetical protein
MNEPDRYLYTLEVFIGEEETFVSRIYNEHDFWAPITARAEREHSPWNDGTDNPEDRSREAMEECVEAIMENFEDHKGYPVFFDFADEAIKAVRVVISKAGNPYWNPAQESLTAPNHV